MTPVVVEEMSEMLMTTVTDKNYRPRAQSDGKNS